MKIILFNARSSGKSNNIKEKSIEHHLKLYRFYQIGIKNCMKQLDYIMPTLVSSYEVNHTGNWISNNTETVAIKRIESKQAIELREEIERFKLIIDSIDAALKELKPEELTFVHYRYFEGLPISEVKTKLGYSEDKSVFKIREKGFIKADHFTAQPSNILVLILGDNKNAATM